MSKRISFHSFRSVSSNGQAVRFGPLAQMNCLNTGCQAVPYGTVINKTPDHSARRHGAQRAFIADMARTLTFVHCAQSRWLLCPLELFKTCDASHSDIFK